MKYIFIIIIIIILLYLLLYFLIVKKFSLITKNLNIYNKNYDFKLAELKQNFHDFKINFSESQNVYDNKTKVNNLSLSFEEFKQNNKEEIEKISSLIKSINNNTETLKEECNNYKTKINDIMSIKSDFNTLKESINNNKKEEEIQNLITDLETFKINLANNNLKNINKIKEDIVSLIENNKTIKDIKMDINDYNLKLTEIKESIDDLTENNKSNINDGLSNSSNKNIQELKSDFTFYKNETSKLIETNTLSIKDIQEIVNNLQNSIQKNVLDEIKETKEQFKKLEKEINKNDLNKILNEQKENIKEIKTDIKNKFEFVSNNLETIYQNSQDIKFIKGKIDSKNTDITKIREQNRNNTRDIKDFKEEIKKIKENLENINKK